MSLDAPVCQSLHFSSRSGKRTSLTQTLPSFHPSPLMALPQSPAGLGSPCPAAVCVWGCWSCRLWLSTEMPLSLWSFSPSGGGVWFTGRLLAPCLFCLQLFHLEPEDRLSLRGGVGGAHWPWG